MLLRWSTFSSARATVPIAYSSRSVFRLLYSVSSAAKLDASSAVPSVEPVVPPVAKPVPSVPLYLPTARSNAALSAVKSWSMLRLVAMLTTATRSAGCIFLFT